MTTLATLPEPDILHALRRAILALPEFLELVGRVGDALFSREQELLADQAVRQGYLRLRALPCDRYAVGATCDYAIPTNLAIRSVFEAENHPPATSAGLLPDGSIPPNSFKYLDRTAELQPAPWGLLDYMFHHARPNTPYGTIGATEGTLLENCSIAGGLATTIHRANKALREVKYPYILSQVPCRHLVYVRWKLTKGETAK